MLSARSICPLHLYISSVHDEMFILMVALEERFTKTDVLILLDFGLDLRPPCSDGSDLSDTQT